VTGVQTCALPICQEQARREAEEAERRAQEERQRKEAEERARKEAEQQARAEEEKRRAESEAGVDKAPPAEQQAAEPPTEAAQPEQVGNNQ